MNITPTVGRRVWFYYGSDQGDPIDAGIIKVWSEATASPGSAVNLDVCDPDTGVHHIEIGIQCGDETTQVKHYRWMPFQQGQAKARSDVGTTGPRADVGHGHP